MSSRLTNLESTIRQIEATVNGIRQDQLDHCVVKQVVLRDLNSQSYQLRAPIEVVIEEYDEEVVASWPEIETFASGNTVGEALADLKNQIVDLYEDLVHSDPESLGKLPLAWKRILSRLIHVNK